MKFKTSVATFAAQHRLAPQLGGRRGGAGAVKGAWRGRLFRGVTILARGTVFTYMSSKTNVTGSCIWDQQRHARVSSRVEVSRVSPRWALYAFAVPRPFR